MSLFNLSHHDVDDDKMVRRRVKHASKLFNITDTIKKQRFLKLAIVLMFTLVIAFTTAIIIVFIATGGTEPSSLVSGFFDFVKWEFAGLSLIKVSENIGNKKKTDKLDEVIEDGADILDNAAELMRDATDLKDDLLSGDENVVG